MNDKAAKDSATQALSAIQAKAKVTATATKKPDPGTVQSIQAAAAQATGGKVHRVEAAGVIKRTSAHFIDPHLIAIDPEWNIRFDLGDIDGLAASIKAQKERDPSSGGLLQPIGVIRMPQGHPLSENGKKLFLTRWGHRRTTAIYKLLKAGETFPEGIPAKIVDRGQDIQAATIEMFVENDHKPLLPMEEAAAYKRLRDGFPEQGIKGMTPAQICKAVGRAMPHVTSMLDLLEAAPEVQEGVKSGELKKMDAKLISQIAKGDLETQKKLTDLAKKAAKGDKKARVELEKGLHAKKVSKAAAKGKTIKMRALSDVELSELGASVASRMAGLLTAANKPLTFDMSKWIKEDDKLALAASYGALQALKAAAGMKIDLDF